MKKFLSLLLAALLAVACIPALADGVYSTEGRTFHVAGAPATFTIALRHDVLTNPNEEDPFVQ